MTRLNYNFRNWGGPIFVEGRDVPCQACEATGICEEGEQLDVDDFQDCLCDHCEGAGIEPWRPAGGRDTSAPIFDLLADGGQVAGWRRRVLRDKHDSRLSDVQKDWARDVHRQAVLRHLGGRPLLGLLLAEQRISGPKLHPVFDFLLAPWAPSERAA